MSVLKQKLDRAAEQFQTHNFKQALELYEDCLSFCDRTDQSQGVIFNIMSTKGALLCILGDIEKAMNTLNDVLRKDPSHYLALMRRSQVYKKKGKFNLALKDLEVVASYCPDNLQITAMKIQIENLKSKNKNGDSSEESESGDDFDQELMLNFSNLKKIDRKSCSIMIDPLKRKSRVTISGDTAFVYQREDDKEKAVAISREQAHQKYLKTFRQIQMDDNTAQERASKIVVKTIGGRSKSILKNKLINTLVETVKQENNPQKYGGKQSKLVAKIKNIEGKMISNKSLSIGSVKEVQFRKSIFTQPTENANTQIEKIKQPKHASRKSCLKRCSFENIAKQVKEKPVPRRSKFETMSRNSIDGSVIRNRKSLLVDEIKQTQKEDKENDSDVGSQYNIYGSNQKVMLSKEMEEKLGFDKPKPEKKPKERGKSILKKSSLLSKEDLIKGKTENPVQISGSEGQKKEGKESETSIQKQPYKKSKKSVMFNKSRFAD